MDLDDGRLAKRRKTKLTLELEDDHRQTKSGMETLPGEIIVDILSRLPITSLVQFKFVCKGWRALAQDPVFAADMCRTHTANTCLILHCDFPIKNHLYFVDLSRNNQEKDKYPDQEVVFGFGFHPKTKEYKVVKIVYYRNTSSSSSRRVVYPHSDVQVFTLGSSAWRSLGKIPYQLVRRSSEALVSGRLHWVSRPWRYHPARRIMSFDIGTEEFKEVQKPDRGGHVSVLRGRLAASVYGNYGKLEIWVMKDYNVKESWSKEFSVGAYMPKCLKQNLERDNRPLKIWKKNSSGKVVRVLSVSGNGEILLEYKNRVLVSYDPKKGKFTDLVFQGIPHWFQTIVHAASFSWINTRFP
ncbi:PTB domain-containing engulfment adapter protein 1 isoform 1 [Hibiscus syriacus]|uniref:PTB domain-containing engulfment adapter protein 1 isoform 1 n=1 Tax=Hibiscus syriacus TaxID=106335 RepID=A0A6A3B2H4_HIBSY|nr:PTB domain-containing engulfment adapter protein 1 isoform 1 [Hibiscus syriacus]